MILVRILFILVLVWPDYRSALSLCVSFQRINIPREHSLVLGCFVGDLHRLIFNAFHLLKPSLFRHPSTLPW